MEPGRAAVRKRSGDFRIGGASRSYRRRGDIQLGHGAPVREWPDFQSFPIVQKTKPRDYREFAWHPAHSG